MQNWMTKIKKKCFREDIPRRDSGIGGGGDASPGTPDLSLVSIPPNQKGKKRNVHKKKQPDIDKRPGEQASA
jgi:hypothetical protein